MPRYFFHVIDGVDILDKTGTLFPDEEAARLHALVLANDLLGNELSPSRIEHGARVVVEDEQQRIILSVEISASEFTRPRNDN